MKSFAFALVLVLATQTFAQDALRSSERLQLADGLYARKMYDLAATEYAAYLTDGPERPAADAATFRLGECNRLLGRLEQADRAYHNVVTHYPDSPFRHKAGFRRADLFMESGRLDAAIPMYEDVLAHSPPPDIRAPALYFLGDALLKAGKTDAARLHFEALRDNAPASTYHAYALLKLGHIYAEGCADAACTNAISLYRQVIDSPPSPRLQAEAIFQLAELHFRRKEHKAAAPLYAKLLAEHPEDARAQDARRQAAWAAYHVGLFADSLNIANRTLGRNPPDDADGWLYLKANCERQLLRFDDAVSSYSRLLKEHPTSAYATSAALEQAQTYYQMKRYADAIRTAKPLTGKPELEPDIYWLLAEAHLGLDAVDETIQYFRLIARDFPQSALACDATYHLAYLLQQRESFHEAASFYTQIADRFPAHESAPRALFAAGYCRAREEKDTEAVTLWNRLVTTFPEHAHVEEALYRKALAEVRLSRDADARASLRALLQQFPTSRYTADAYYWQGVLQRAAGAYQDAANSLRHALAAATREDLTRETQHQLATALQQDGQNAEAAEIFDTLLDSPISTSLTPETLSWLMIHHYHEKDYAAALTPAHLLVKRFDSPAWQQAGWLMIARCEWARAGHDAEAAAAFARVLELEQAGAAAAEAALRLGQIRQRAGNTEDAHARFELAAQLAGEESQTGVRAHAYMGLGHTDLAANNFERAARYFMSVAILYDDADLTPEALFYAARAYAHLARHDEARQTIEELRRRYPESSWASKTDAQDVPDPVHQKEAVPDA